MKKKEVTNKCFSRTLSIIAYSLMRVVSMPVYYLFLIKIIHTKVRKRGGVAL